MGWCCSSRIPVEDALIPGPSFSAAARSQRSTSILTLSALPCGHRPPLTESFVEEGGGHDAEHVSSRERSQQDIGYNYVRWAASHRVTLLSSHTSLSSPRLNEPQARTSLESWNGLPRGRVGSPSTTGDDRLHCASPRTESDEMTPQNRMWSVSLSPSHTPTL